MIVKLQRPLASVEALPPCLIYDESRRWMCQVYLPDDEIERLLGDRLKGYFEAFLVMGEPVLIRAVPDQPW